MHPPELVIYDLTFEFLFRNRPLLLEDQELVLLLHNFVHKIAFEFVRAERERAYGRLLEASHAERN